MTAQTYTSPLLLLHTCHYTAQLYETILQNSHKNSCSSALDLPTCAKWLPDPSATLKLFATQFPIAIGCWMLIGIVAASMSTSTGALLAIATVSCFC
jgi:hypothetical protein